MHNKNLKCTMRNRIRKHNTINAKGGKVNNKFKHFVGKLIVRKRHWIMHKLVPTIDATRVA